MCFVILSEYLIHAAGDIHCDMCSFCLCLCKAHKGQAKVTSQSYKKCKEPGFSQLCSMINYTGDRVMKPVSVYTCMGMIRRPWWWTEANAWQLYGIFRVM